MCRRVVVFLLAAVMVRTSGGALRAQQLPPSKDDIALYKQVLIDIGKDIEKHYYDPTFKGLNLPALVASAQAKVVSASSTSDALDAVLAVTDAFDDSHTRFWPPQRATQVDYGWKMAAVGGAALVIAVDPASDASKQGLAVGDRVLSVNRLQPTRDTIKKITHYYKVVRPQSQQRVSVSKPDGTVRTYDIQSKVTRRDVVQITDLIEELRDADIASDDVEVVVDPRILVWRMTEFRDASAIREHAGSLKKAKALVLDLRGNPGGDIEGLTAIVSMLFDREVLVMTQVARTSRKPAVAKPKGQPFGGPVIVLIDSRSASASECLARVVQIEKRGTVIGDRSAGAVMGSRALSHSYGIGRSLFYATQVSVVDAIMSDGSSLERTGVTPDEIRLPSQSDLAARRDPVLSRAVELAGGTLTPEQAGALWPKRLASR